MCLNGEERFKGTTRCVGVGFAGTILRGGDVCLVEVGGLGGGRKELRCWGFGNILNSL